MVLRRRLKGIRTRHKSVRPTGRRRHRWFRISSVADLTVVVLLRFVIGRVRGSQKGNSDQLTRTWPRGQTGDHILVLIVGKLDGELLWPVRIAKTETRVIARRNLCMTDSANDGLGSFKKLCAVTANARVVTGKVRHVRKLSDLLPIGSGCLMTSAAGFLMCFGDMQEL